MNLRVLSHCWVSSKPFLAAAEKVSYTKFWRIKPLISTSGGRFPWATPQLPRKQNPLPAGFSAVAFPTGVAALCSNQLDLLITYSFSVVSPSSQSSKREHYQYELECSSLLIEPCVRDYRTRLF